MVIYNSTDRLVSRMKDNIWIIAISKLGLRIKDRVS